jgi:transketolase
MSVAYPNLKVRLVGFLPGIATPGGVTHQSIDDIAIMRVIPNMTVLEVGDATEVESVLDIAHSIDGPVYLRMLRGEVPRLFDTPMEFNKARVLTSAGDDITDPTDIVIVTSGICTEEAMRAVPAMVKRGLKVTHLHVSTLKPFSDPTVTAALASARKGVITMENHLITGGLGSAVAEVMAENAMAVPLSRIGLNDTYAHGASLPYLLKEYQLDARALVERVEILTGSPLNIPDSDLTEIRVAALHSAAKAEAL